MENFKKRTNEEKNYSDEVVIGFWNELVRIMKEKNYVLVKNINKEKFFSECLVPAGTEEEVTYYGKPELSFRIADTWTWYAPLSKCSKENEIQCLNTSMPSVHPRQN